MQATGALLDPSRREASAIDSCVDSLLRAKGTVQRLYIEVSDVSSQKKWCFHKDGNLPVRPLALRTPRLDKTAAFAKIHR